MLLLAPALSLTHPTRHLLLPRLIVVIAIWLSANSKAVQTDSPGDLYTRR